MLLHFLLTILIDITIRMESVFNTIWVTISENLDWLILSTLTISQRWAYSSQLRPIDGSDNCTYAVSAASRAALAGAWCIAKYLDYKAPARDIGPDSAVPAVWAYLDHICPCPLA